MERIGKFRFGGFLGKSHRNTGSKLKLKMSQFEFKQFEFRLNRGKLEI